MRSAISIIFVALAFSAIAGAQDKKPPKAPKTITLTGCVEPDPAQADRFTIIDKQDGSKYRVTGKDFREYLGRPVELDGGVVVKGLKISGGLLPNANIAAQAGSIDPARAAVQAATSNSTTGTPVDIQEFRVKAIRPAQSGTCQ
jgi:hypothetical protein